MTSGTPDSQASTGAKAGIVAAGTIGMNAAMYGFTVLAARLLIPAELGAVTALLGVILMGNVASLGLQATIARRLALGAGDDLVADAVRVTVVSALGVGAVVTLSALVLTPLLRLDSYLLVVLCGATLVPLTVMGGQSGVAQGTERWRALAAIQVSSGVGRFLIGGVALAISPTTTSAMIAVAVSAWVPVLVGATLVPVRWNARPLDRPLFRDALLGTHALFAFFVLSNLDALIARSRFDAHDSGLYASGLILTKAAVFFPQFVSVFAFPAMARATGRQAQGRATAAVLVLGAVAVAATALLPQVALILVGGDRYAEVQDRLWLFALSGSMLAVVNLLVFGALARRSHGVVGALWVAVATVLAVGVLADIGISSLVVTVAGVATVLSAWIAWHTDRALRAEPDQAAAG